MGTEITSSCPAAPPEPVATVKVRVELPRSRALDAVLPEAGWIIACEDEALEVTLPVRATVPAPVLLLAAPRLIVPPVMLSAAVVIVAPLERLIVPPLVVVVAKV